MTDELKCGVCGLPIHPSESGIRHFGFYTAHSEQRCVSLLRGRLADAEAALASRPDTPARPDREAVAKVIYETWREMPGWVPWVERGNSDRQIDARRAADRALALLPPADGWRSIDTAPMDGQFLGICMTAYAPEARQTWRRADGTFMIYSQPDKPHGGGVTPWFPTHWMPLPPAPPEAVGDE